MRPPGPTLAQTWAALPKPVSSLSTGGAGVGVGVEAGSSWLFAVTPPPVKRVPSAHKPDGYLPPGAPPHSPPDPSSCLQFSVHHRPSHPP